MSEALQIVASLFTIWAQSSVLAENKEFDRFKDEPVIEQQEPNTPKNLKVMYNESIVLAKYQIVSQTKLGE